MKKFKNIVINILTSTCTLVIFLIVIEIIFRSFYPQDLSGTWRTMSEKGYMLNKASWTARHQSGERIVNYHFNNFHLRGKNADTSSFKILTLGDSFTFGWLLEEDNTYIGQMQKLANTFFGNNAIQFLNGAAGGWGTADMLDYLKEFGDKINPQMVLIYFNNDDIGRSLNRHKYYNPDSFLEKIKTTFNNSSFYQWLLEHSNFLQWIRKSMVNISLKKSSQAEVPAGENDIIIPGTSLDSNDMHRSIIMEERLFVEINNWCAKRNISLMVLTTGWFFKSSMTMNDPEFVFLQSAGSFFSTHSIPFYDLTPFVANEIERNSKEYIIENDYHPNEKGAKIIADNSWHSINNVIDKEYKKWKMNKPQQLILNK